MNTPRRPQPKQRMLIVAVTVLAFPIVIGTLGFVAQLFKASPDASVMAACVSLTTSGLTALAALVYTRDREGGN